MKKQVVSVLAVCTMAAALLSGCGKSHVHQAVGTWDADISNHWKVCADCGERTEESAHTLDEAECCTVCGASIADWGDNKSLYLYNENGDPLKMAEYDGDGNVITETVCKYEYDSNGALTCSTTTTDGTLTEECTYTTTHGESILTQCTSYMEDGSKFVNDYDENGNVTRLISYAADGTVDFQSESEYALASDGTWYEAKCVSTEQDGSMSVGTFFENGDQTGLERYDADGSILYSCRWEYTYDENGIRQTMQYYCNDLLSAETIYSTLVSDDGSVTYPETVTEYHEDGSKTVTVYDADDTMLSQTQYDADGDVIS